MVQAKRKIKIMKKILMKLREAFKEDPIPAKSKEEENAGIIRAYHLVKEADPSYSEPNYTLAEKVFRDYNDFNLKNIDGINPIYLGYIPKSLLPYPKNYIKCAYYIFLEKAKKAKNLEMFNLIQEVGMGLFMGDYPDYAKYKESLKSKRAFDEHLKNTKDEMNLREAFKKLYGVYEVSEEDYYSSPSATDSTDEKLIYDFGILPTIEEDVNFDEIIKNNNL
jgi:hypothetical protein